MSYPPVSRNVYAAFERCFLAMRQSKGLCNGHQIVAFIGSRSDGIPPIDGHCLIFQSLDEMAADFRTLWENLSKPGVAAYTLTSTLNQDNVQPPPEKLSHRIPNYPGFKNRNPFQTDLQILGGLFIEDVVRVPQLEDDFLKHCYAPSGALSQHALISKQILQARYSSLFEKELGGPAIQPAHTKHGITEEFAKDILAASLKRRAIILLGDVGVGKSIFIRNLVRVEGREIFEKAITLYIDFGKEPALAGDLENFVLRRCASQLLNDHKIDIEENTAPISRLPRKGTATRSAEIGIYWADVRVVPGARIELATPAFSGRRSNTELPRQ